MNIKKNEAFLIAIWHKMAQNGTRFVAYLCGWWGAKISRGKNKKKLIKTKGGKVMKWSYKNTRGERFFALDCPAVSTKKQTADYSIFFVKNLAIYASRVLNYGANNDLTLNCLKSSGAGLDAKNIAESGLGAVFKHNDWAWLSLNKINKIVADASVSEGTKEAIKALKNDAVNNGSVFVAIKSNKKCQKCGDLK